MAMTVKLTCRIRERRLSPPPIARPRHSLRRSLKGVVGLAAIRVSLRCSRR